MWNWKFWDLKYECKILIKSCRQNILLLLVQFWRVVHFLELMTRQICSFISSEMAKLKAVTNTWNCSNMSMEDRLLSGSVTSELLGNYDQLTNWLTDRPDWPHWKWGVIGKYRVFIKNCAFSQYTATHPLLEGEQLIWTEILMYSHSYWLAIFFPTNSSPVLERERSQNIENSWKNTIFN